MMEVDSDADAIRRAHIQHEAAVRAVGSLYYFVGGFLVIVGLCSLSQFAIETPTDRSMRPFLLVMTAIGVALGALWIALARGLRQLRRWARTVATVLSCFGLFGFPIGTLIHGYILYVLHSKQGDRIFRADYPAIVSATPNLKPVTSPGMWIALALPVAILGAMVFLALLQR